MEESKGRGRRCWRVAADGGDSPRRTRRTRRRSSLSELGKKGGEFRPGTEGREGKHDWWGRSEGFWAGARRAGRRGTRLAEIGGGCAILCVLGGCWGGGGGELRVASSEKRVPDARAGEAARGVNDGRQRANGALERRRWSKGRSEAAEKAEANGRRHGTGPESLR